MATEKLSFSGKVKWCRPDQANEWGKFSTRFYPDADSLEKMKKLPIKNEWKSDLDGEYTNVSCPQKREIRGRTLVERVDLRDKNGNPHYTDQHGFVGDGSDVVIHVDFYDHPIKGSQRRGHAIKWTGMDIKNLAPYKVSENIPVNTTPTH